MLVRKRANVCSDAEELECKYAINSPLKSLPVFPYRFNIGILKHVEIILHTGRIRIRRIAIHTASHAVFAVLPPDVLPIIIFDGCIIDFIVHGSCTTSLTYRSFEFMCLSLFLIVIFRFGVILNESALPHLKAHQGIIINGSTHAIWSRLSINSWYGRYRGILIHFVIHLCKCYVYLWRLIIIILAIWILVILVVKCYVYYRLLIIITIINWSWCIVI